MEMLSSILWSIRVVTVTEYHEADKCLTRVRLEARSNSLTSWIRFGVLLSAGLLWRFAELDWWSGATLLLIFLLPSLVKRIQLSGMKRRITEIAEAVGYDCLKTAH